MDSTLLYAGSIFLGAVAAAVAGFAGFDPMLAFWQRTQQQYTDWVGSKLRWMFDRTPVRDFFIRHALFIVLGIIVGWAVLPGPGPFFFGLLGFWYPFQRLRSQVRDRRVKIEEQLERALLTISTTLRATPNFVDAVATTVRHLEKPIAEEFDLLLRENKVGLTLEDALRSLGRRVESRYLDMAITSITIGRATGGDLPAILDRVCGVIRETQRLEGLVDAKTAEGRAQAWVLGLLPWIMGSVLYYLDPRFVMPLFKDPLGWGILTLIAVLEIVGVYGIRKATAIH
jgi:tight adherence protein B